MHLTIHVWMLPDERAPSLTQLEPNQLHVTSACMLPTVLPGVQIHGSFTLLISVLASTTGQPRPPAYLLAPLSAFLLT